MITWFLLRRKLNYLLSGKDIRSLLITVLLLVSGTVTGFALAYAYNMVRSDSRLSGFGFFLNAGISFLPVLFVFFPSFNPRKTFISGIYPVSRYRIASADLVLHGFKPGNIVLAVFLCTFYLLAKGFSWMDVLGSFCFLAFGFVLSECLLLLLAIRKYVLFVCALLLYPAAFICLYRQWMAQNVGGMALAVLMTGIFMTFYSNDIPAIAAPVSPGRRSSGSCGRSQLTRRTFYKKQIVYISLSIGFLIKLALLAGVCKELTKNGGSAWDQFIFYFSFPPLVLFTYLFNNAWGLDHDFSATVVLAARDPFKVFCRSYLTLLAPVAIADLCLSGLFVWYSHSHLLELSCFYLSYLAYLSGVGIYFSFAGFRKIHRTFRLLTLRNNTSMLANFASAFPVSVQLLLHHWKLTPYPFFCLLLMIAVCVLTGIFSGKQRLVGRLTYNIFTN